MPDGHPKPDCAVCLYGDDLLPAQVTEVLGIPETLARLKGQRKASKIGKYERVQKTGVWMASSRDHVDSEDLGDHLKWLMASVEPSRLELLHGIERVSIVVAICTTEEVSGLSLPKRFVEFVAALHAQLDVCVDFWSS